MFTVPFHRSVQYSSPVIKDAQLYLGTLHTSCEGMYLNVAHILWQVNLEMLSTYNAIESLWANPTDGTDMQTQPFIEMFTLKHLKI